MALTVLDRVLSLTIVVCMEYWPLKEMGFETIMVNCNPETVSTDYDISDRLYFEPLTFEDVIEIIEKEKPEGVIVQFGGQTPLKLAVPLFNAGVKILGTSPDSIDMAENRERFAALLSKLESSATGKRKCTIIYRSQKYCSFNRLSGLDKAFICAGRQGHEGSL